ncbi:MFS general substrate transporter [Rhizoctonia solani]|uniref:MFS general substrate transporter n=1 Tax=Rhizoctonia solani TaxID=456999 RepID=A0A8H7H854_9AGAM|nr:MFS general substrate transporter [Rhizoctonia solani]
MTNPTPEITQVVEAVPGTTTPISQASTPTVNSSTGPSPAKVEGKIRRFDFGFIPIPTYLRHHPEKPFHFTLALNIFFGIASTLTVGNLYYCQPILVRLAQSFGVTDEEITIIPTLTQAGYAVGLLLISPLGDLVRRRQLLLLLGCMIGAFTLGLALAPSKNIFGGLSFVMGVFTVVPQIMIPLAADLAPPERRASAISIVLSGLLLGILFARVISGIIANFASWRIIYWISCGLQFGNVFAMWLFVPDYPAKNTGLSYLGILYTMARYAVTEPTLIQCCLIGFLSSAVFVNFWVNLTFLLDDAPYNYSTLGIGLFGLIGMMGVMTAPLVGRFVDKLDGWTTTVIAIMGGIGFQAIYTGAAGINIGAVVVACFGIDVASQMNQVSNSSRIYALVHNYAFLNHFNHTLPSSIEPLARARMNAVFIISLFLGQVMGTSVGTQVYLKYGWRPSGALALGFYGLQLILLFIRGPKVGRKTWLGWKAAPKEPEAAAPNQAQARAEKDAEAQEVRQVENS